VQGRSVQRRLKRLLMLMMDCRAVLPEPLYPSSYPPDRSLETRRICQAVHVVYSWELHADRCLADADRYVESIKLKSWPPKCLRGKLGVVRMRQEGLRAISSGISKTEQSCVSDVVRFNEAGVLRRSTPGPTINERKTCVSTHGSLSLAWCKQIGGCMHA
jgi:hypothetical protein